VVLMNIQYFIYHFQSFLLKYHNCSLNNFYQKYTKLFIVSYKNYLAIIEFIRYMRQLSSIYILTGNSLKCSALLQWLTRSTTFICTAIKTGYVQKLSCVSNFCRVNIHFRKKYFPIQVWDLYYDMLRNEIL